MTVGGGVTVVRRRRRRRDQLDVCGPDGQRLGWFDLTAGVTTVEVEDAHHCVVEAVRLWHIAARGEAGE
jgi:hypothetical protein